MSCSSDIDEFGDVEDSSVESGDFEDSGDLNNSAVPVDPDSHSDSQDLSLKINDYIIVKLLAKKAIKYFIGMIIDIDEEGVYFVKFLKETSTEKFIFPVIEDVGLVKVNDIVAKLPQPEVQRRGEGYTFNSKTLYKYFQFKN